LASVLAATQGRLGVWLDRLLPLRHWLGTEAATNTEQGQARTRLICTLAGLCGFGIVGLFVELPAGIVATAIVFPLYAIAYALAVNRRPVPTRARRVIALLADNLTASYIASFGGGFAAYVGFNFLTTMGWGLRFGRHYLFVATAIAIAGMAWNLVASPYWREHQLFGGSVIFGLLAATINAAILLERIALGNRRLAEKMEEIAQLAWRDQLTKLPNRLHFQERLAQALAAAARKHREVALLLFDIDGFKAVNDTLGHEAGDRLLQEIGRCVGRRVRQADTFARFGGDEFVVLMELNRGTSDAVRVAESIIRVIADTDLFPHVGIRVGASVGIACWMPLPGERPNSDEFLKQADRAMYEAKRAGKGCYRFARRPYSGVT
jgi:diguanylate cyclase (GGDEF)-like protein